MTLTPKEKAQELFDRFNSPDRTNYPYIHNAQQCSLIAVDEIIKMYNQMNAQGLLKPNAIGFELIEIKEEIEKL